MRLLVLGGVLAALLTGPAFAPAAGPPHVGAASLCPTPAHHAPPPAVKPLGRTDFYGFHTPAHLRRAADRRRRIAPARPCYSSVDR